MIYAGNDSNIGISSIPSTIGPIIPISVPIFGGMPIWSSPFLAAIMSAFAIFFITYFFSRREHQKTIQQRQQQEYSYLKGRNDIIAATYESYAIAFITFYIQRAIRARTGLPFEPLILNDNERWMKRADELSKDVDTQREKLSEILGMITFIFRNIEQKVNNVEMRNLEFTETIVPNLSNRYRSYIPERVADLDPSIAPPIGKLLNEREQQQILDLENSLMSDVKEDTKRDIETCIRDPVDELLEAMKDDIEMNWIKRMKSYVVKAQKYIIRATLR
jgi:hypothetical protein